MEIVFGTQSFSQSEMRVLSINLSRLLISSQTAQPKGGTLPLLRWNGDIRGRGNGVGKGEDEWDIRLHEKSRQLSLYSIAFSKAMVLGIYKHNVN